jgi:hypothetical protein
MFKRLILGITIAGAATLGAYDRFFRPWHRRWGATDAELQQSMPGDEGVKNPNFLTTRAVTINARPAEIWPWLVQLGVGRGGYYTYTWLPNVAGLRYRNADTILPEFQHLEVGDTVPIDARGIGFTVGAIDPERSLLLTVPDPDHSDAFITAWTFLLQPIDSEHTRLIVRWRSNFREPLTYAPLAPVFFLFLDPVDFLMSRQMLIGIKRRAERSHQEIPKRVGGSVVS